MKQRITFTRTQTVTIEFDYPVDPFTRANAEFWANQSLGGQSPIGVAGNQVPIPTSTDWKVLRADPAVCQCQPTKTKVLRPKRKIR